MGLVEDLGQLLGWEWAGEPVLAELGVLDLLADLGGGGEVEPGAGDVDGLLEEGEDDVVGVSGGQVADQPPVALLGLVGHDGGDGEVGGLLGDGVLDGETLPPEADVSSEGGQGDGLEGDASTNGQGGAGGGEEGGGSGGSSQTGEGQGQAGADGLTGDGAEDGGGGGGGDGADGQSEANLGVHGAARNANE